MADLKISALPAAAALAGTEVLPVVQSATTKKATVAQLVTAILPDGDKGDIVVSSAGLVWAIDVGAVTPAKAAAALKDASLSGEIATPTVRSYTIALKVPVACTINELAAKLTSGTATAKVTIDGVDVTGTSTAFSSTEAAGTATAANAAAAGTTIALVVTAVATPVDFAFTIKATLQ